MAIYVTDDSVLLTLSNQITSDLFGVFFFLEGVTSLLLLSFLLQFLLIKNLRNRGKLRTLFFLMVVSIRGRTVSNFFYMSKASYISLRYHTIG